jgi:integrase
LLFAVRVGSFADISDRGSDSVAHITKIGDKWRAEVCIDRKRKAKTFGTKREAKDWADSQELDGLLPHHTLRQAIEKYRPIAETHKGYQSELSRLNALEKKLDCIDTPLEMLKPSMFKAWRDARLKEVAPVSVRRELIILSAIFTQAITEWGWLHESPLEGVKWPAVGPARQRGITQEEITGIAGKLQEMRSGPQVADIFALSIETGMRLSEMLSLRWADVTEKSVLLRATKNGDARKVPLSLAAREVIKKRKKIDPESVFTLTTQVASKTFARAAEEAGHGDVHLHDARSEAITRMSKKVDVLELARIIGHRDLKSLLHYYAEPIDNIADKL